MFDAFKDLLSAYSDENWILARQAGIAEKLLKELRGDRREGRFEALQRAYINTLGRAERADAKRDAAFDKAYDLYGDAIAPVVERLRLARELQ